MTGDWAQLTDERRAALTTRLKELREHYRHSTFALDTVIPSARKAATKHGETVAGIREKLVNAKPDYVDDGVPVKLIEIEKAADGLHKLTLSAEARDTVIKIIDSSSEGTRRQPQVLNEMALIYACALFDGLVADTLTALIAHLPGQLRNQRQVSYEEALSAATREELISLLARREMLEVTRLNFGKQMDHFKSRYQIDPIKNDQQLLTNMNRIIDERNLFVHNSGVITQEYVKKFELSVSSIGSRLSMDAQTTDGYCSTIQRTGTKLINACVNKFSAKREITPKSQ